LIEGLATRPKAGGKKGKEEERQEALLIMHTVGQLKSALDLTRAVLAKKNSTVHVANRKRRDKSYFQLLSAHPTRRPRVLNTSYSPNAMYVMGIKAKRRA
jgi:hypothetical protein